MEEGSPLVKPDAHEKLVRLTFHRECVGEHVISTISRDFGVDVNIVLANVEVLEDNPAPLASSRCWAAGKNRCQSAAENTE